MATPAVASEVAKGGVRFIFFFRGGECVGDGTGLGNLFLPGQFRVGGGTGLLRNLPLPGQPTACWWIRTSSRRLRPQRFRIAYSTLLAQLDVLRAVADPATCPPNPCACDGADWRRVTEKSEGAG